MRWLSAWLGGRRERERAVAGLLRDRGASRSLRRFAEPFGSDAGAYWAAVPRGTWALRSAARLGVSRPLLAAALADLADDARARRDEPPGVAGEPAGALRGPALETGGVSDSLLGELEALGRVFATERLALERFASECTQLLLAIIDADPSVREVRIRVEEAQRWGRIEEVLGAMEDHDEAYATRHAAMARIVRRHVHATHLRDAIRGRTDHPYR